MKLKVAIIVSLCSYSANAQGTFQNLNFESANIAGYPPGSGDVPISAALPGWSGFYGNSPTSQVSYDGISLGGDVISVIDNQAPSYAPLQGTYSVFLFGGGAPSVISAEITQTGLVPAGTRSLLFDGYVSGAPFVVTLGGQTINMVPLETFPSSGSTPAYSLYGGNIPSAFAGQSETLTFTEPAPANSPPSMFELDNISFSPNTVPEPSPLALTGIGALLFALYRRFARR
jgi:hypothetical protein